MLPHTLLQLHHRLVQFQMHHRLMFPQMLLCQLHLACSMVPLQTLLLRTQQYRHSFISPTT
jgi:hypothetical protein